ncbi:hypothetical protein IWZ01DRAFT_480489 [Phyllosticta capitalensis]
MDGTANRRAQALAHAARRDSKDLKATQQTIAAETEALLRINDRMNTFEREKGLWRKAIQVSAGRFEHFLQEQASRRTDSSEAAAPEKISYDEAARIKGAIRRGVYMDADAPKKAASKKTAHRGQVKQERAGGQPSPSETAASKETADHQQVKKERATGPASSSEAAAPKNTAQKEEVHREQAKLEQASGQAGPSEAAAPKNATRKETAQRIAAIQAVAREVAALDEQVRQGRVRLNQERVRLQAARQRAAQQEAATLHRAYHLVDCYLALANDPTSDIALRRAMLENVAVDLDAIFRKSAKRQFGVHLQNDLIAIGLTAAPDSCCSAWDSGSGMNKKKPFEYNFGDFRPRHRLNKKQRPPQAHSRD